MSDAVAPGSSLRGRGLPPRLSIAWPYFVSAGRVPLELTGFDLDHPGGRGELHAVLEVTIADPAPSVRLLVRHADGERVLLDTVVGHCVAEDHDAWLCLDLGRREGQRDVLRLTLRRDRDSWSRLYAQTDLLAEFDLPAGCFDPPEVTVDEAAEPVGTGVGGSRLNGS